MTSAYSLLTCHILLALAGIVVCLQTQSRRRQDVYQFNLTFDPSPLLLLEWETRELAFNLTYLAKENLRMKVSLDYDPVARIDNTSLPELTATEENGGEVGEAEGRIVLTGIRLGETFLVFNITQRDTGEEVLETLPGSAAVNGSAPAVEDEVTARRRARFRVVVLREKGIVEFLFRTITTILVVLIVLCMGCGLDLKIIKAYLQKPIAPAIGFCSQFLVMPLTAFGISNMVRLPPAFGFGLLTIGCSPGGGGSNMWTILLHGDLNLSMTMTFISSIAALAMMPLWTFLLGRFFIDTTRIRIPYENIAINILQVVIPVIVGVLIKIVRPNWAKKLAGLVRIFALCFIIYIITFGTYANLYIYRLMGDYPYLLPTGACLPWSGFIFGFVIAKICRRPNSQAITIAIETGIQNIGIAFLILLYSMPQPQGDLGGVMPMIVAVFTPAPLYIVLLIVTIRRKCCRQKKKEEEDDVKEESGDEKEKTGDEDPAEDIPLKADCVA